MGNINEIVEYFEKENAISLDILWIEGINTANKIRDVIKNNNIEDLEYLNEIVTILQTYMPFKSVVWFDMALIFRSWLQKNNITIKIFDWDVYD